MKVPVVIRNRTETMTGQFIKTTNHTCHVVWVIVRKCHSFYTLSGLSYSIIHWKRTSKTLEEFANLHMKRGGAYSHKKTLFRYFFLYLKEESGTFQKSRIILKKVYYLTRNTCVHLTHQYLVLCHFYSPHCLLDSVDCDYYFLMP